MKKITTVFKTMLLAVMVLVMAQGCVPNSNVVNPMADLTGKIKSSVVTMNTILGQNNLSYNFEYDSSAKISSIEVASSLMATNVRYAVVYQTDKFIIKDSTGITGLIYFLKPGTNLVDSIYDYMAGEKIHSIYVEREISNNIKNITMKSTEFLKYILKDFVYENGNIKSFKSLSYDFAMSIIMSEYEVQYDSSRNKKPGTDFNFNFYMFSQSVALADLIFEPEIYGLSFGNTHINAMSSIAWNEQVDLYFKSGTKNFSYTSYTPYLVIFNTTATEFPLSPVSVFNVLEKVNNQYY